MLGVGRQTVTDWLTPNAGTGIRRKAIPDSRVKLSQDAKKKVAKRVKAGESQAQVAADYGVSQQHVSKVAKAIVATLRAASGRWWKFVGQNFAKSTRLSWRR